MFLTVMYVMLQLRSSIENSVNQIQDGLLLSKLNVLVVDGMGQAISVNRLLKINTKKI